MPEEDGIRLIRNEALEKGVEMSDEYVIELYQRTGGVPIAMVYAIGQVRAGHTFESVLERLTRPNNNITCKIFWPTLPSFIVNMIRPRSFCALGFPSSNATKTNGVWPIINVHSPC